MLPQPRCPLVSEWINGGTSKQWDSSQLKRNQLSRHEETWRKLKCVVLSERNQPERVMCCMIPSIRRSRKG